MKCEIVQMCDDHTIVFTMEEAEREFGNELALVLLGRHDFFAGSLVSNNTPLGYVEEGTSLVSWAKVFSEQERERYG